MNPDRTRFAFARPGTVLANIGAAARPWPRAAALWSPPRRLLALAVACTGLAWTGKAAEAPERSPSPAEPSAADPAIQPAAVRESAEKEKSDQQKRNEALERLARGDMLQEPVQADDRLPRNREARLIYYEPPKYPKEMAGTGLSAEVTLSVMVDRQGRASHVRVEDSADPLFTNAALDAVSQWAFLPRVREGKISNERMRLTVLVSEEVGDRSVHDYPGGRIALEDIKYEVEPDSPLRRFFGLRPAYPFNMLAAGEAGEVVIECTVGDEGIPRDIKIVEATNRDFAFACQGALVHWEFSPATKVGHTVQARLRYRMSFQPQELDPALLNLAKELKAGHTGGLETARSVTQAPRVVRSLNPSSYDGTRSAPRRRRVTLELVVTPEGDVRLPRVLSAPDPLSGYIALAAVAYWHFDPARKNGVPVAEIVSLPVTF